MFLRSLLSCSVGCVVLVGCTAAHDAPPTALDGGATRDGAASVDAAPWDAALGLDGSQRDAASLDAAPSDAARADAATADAALACQRDPAVACVRTGVAAVPCGALVCSGATPVCCARVGDVPAATCIAASAPCTGSSDVTANITNACDDADDCKSAQLCRDGYNKGLGHNDGSRCEDVCSRPALTPYRFQRCTQSCECDLGSSCDAGVCTP